MGRIYPEVEKLLEELKSRQVFDADFNQYLPIRKTFLGVINQILEMKHCNSVMFCENIDFRACGRADNVLSQIILDNTEAADKIPKESQGLFITHDGVVFQGYLFDEKAVFVE